MSGLPNNTHRFKATRETQYKNPKEEKVIKVPVITDAVKPGDTVEIVIPGEEGFTVYLPYGEHFNAQIFEAVENPEWALAEQEASEGGSAVTGPVWGVRMIRTSKTNTTPKGDFPFCIFCKEFQTFAVSQSPPRMNLHP